MLVIQNNQSGKMVPWWIWRKQPVDLKDPDTFAISRQGPPAAHSFPPEEGVATFDWGVDETDGSYRDYFLWRLTGLGRNALLGIWDEPSSEERRVPRRVRVTGSPDIVERFTWPSAGDGKK